MNIRYNHNLQNINRTFGAKPKATKCGEFGYVHKCPCQRKFIVHGEMPNSINIMDTSIPVGWLRNTQYTCDQNARIVQ